MLSPEFRCVVVSFLILFTMMIVLIIMTVYVETEIMVIITTIISILFTINSFVLFNMICFYGYKVRDNKIEAKEYSKHAKEHELQDLKV